LTPSPRYRHRPGEFFNLSIEGAGVLVYVYGHVNSIDDLDAEAREFVEGADPAALMFEHWFTKKMPAPPGDEYGFDYYILSPQRSPGPQGWFPFTEVKERSGPFFYKK